MNTPEKRIDTVLHALAAASPRDGMEQRIVQALRNEEAQGTTVGSAWYAHPWLLRSAGAVALALLAVMVARHHSQSVRSVDTARQAAPERAGKPSAPPAVSSVSASKPAGKIPHGKAATQAIQPLEASFPAPPIPLTQQERLLLQLVHRDDPQQLAMLTPAALDASLQRDRQQVREFFTPPTRMEPQPDPYDNISGGTQ